MNYLRRYGLALAVGLVATSSVSAGAATSTTYMSCGNPPTYDSGLEISLPGHIHYARHPSHCLWTDNGFTYRMVDLVGLHWRNWGANTAFANAKIVDNHDQDNNGFQRHRVRVWVSAPRLAVGSTGGARLYYTRLRVMGSRHYRFSTVEKLFRPGEPPVYTRDG